MHLPLLRHTLLPAGAVIAASLFVASPALAADGPRRAPNHKIGHSTSTNWSGYAVSGHGPYTRVAASWTQPAVNCQVTPRGWSSFWVGLDGDTTSTVEQTGTEADCSGGSPVYSAWYEMYPKYPVTYRNRVSAGDHMSAWVTSTGRGGFQLILSDTTKGWTQTTSQRLNSAKLGSAEVIAEAPTGSSGVLPLADFGTAEFSAAAVNGSLLTKSTPGLDPISMSSGTSSKALVSTLGNGAFTDTWQHQ